MPDTGKFEASSSLHSMLFSSSHRHPDKSLFYMLVCRVVLGCGLKLRRQEVNTSAFQPGNRRELKYIPEAQPPVFHHSLLVDGSPKHNEVVIFHSDQTFPEYLLAFTRE